MCCCLNDPGELSQYHDDSTVNIVHAVINSISTTVIELVGPASCRYVTDSCNVI